MTIKMSDWSGISKMILDGDDNCQFNRYLYKLLTHRTTLSFIRSSHRRNILIHIRCFVRPPVQLRNQMASIAQSIALICVLINAFQIDVTLAARPKKVSCTTIGSIASILFAGVDLFFFSLHS